MRVWSQMSRLDFRVNFVWEINREHLDAKNCFDKSQNKLRKEQKKKLQLKKTATFFFEKY